VVILRQGCNSVLIVPQIAQQSQSMHNMWGMRAGCKLPEKSSFRQSKAKPDPLFRCSKAPVEHGVSSQADIEIVARSADAMPYRLLAVFNQGAMDSFALCVICLL